VAAAMLGAPVLAQAATFEGPEVHWFGLSPLLVLTGGCLALMVAAALIPGRWPRGVYAMFTAVVAGTAGTLAIFLWDDVQDEGPRGLVGDAIGLDGFSLFFTVVICATVLLSALFLDDYLRREDLDGCEVYALALLAAIGGIVLASANDLIVLFLGLETLSLAQYVMAASHVRRPESQEAAIKYFILGGFSSAFLLYGIALTYGAIGSTNLSFVVEFLRERVLIEEGLLLAGIALMLVGLSFKISAVPFHAWTPDVYEGSPTPVTGFMASAAKAAAFAALILVLVVAFDAYRDDWQPALWLIAIVTLLVGSVLAVVQTNVKRMLAYSSVSHAGFILVGVQAANDAGTAGALFYVLAYAVMVIGTFGVVELVAGRGDGHTDLDDFRGLARTRPLLAFTLTVFLLAQAGVPLTSGFVAKFGVIEAAAEQGGGFGYSLALIAMLSAVIAAFLYLRIIVSMYLADPVAGDEAREPVAVPFSAGVGLAISVAFTLLLGFLPWWAIDWTRDAVTTSIATGGG
jgi:NADH-quinone oxidoreductase subunit N